MNQLGLFTSTASAPAAHREPYRPYDAAAARSMILARLHCAAGGWVRRRELSRATSMRPAFVSSLLAELCSSGSIERTYTLPIVHPMHGNMGQTTGYRIPQPAQVAT